MRQPNPQHRCRVLVGYLPMYPRLQARRHILTCFFWKFSVQTQRERENKSSFLPSTWSTRVGLDGKHVSVFRLTCTERWCKIWHLRCEIIKMILQFLKLQTFRNMTECGAQLVSDSWGCDFLISWYVISKTHAMPIWGMCWVADPWLRFEMVHGAVLRAYSMEGDLGRQWGMRINSFRKMKWSWILIFHSSTFRKFISWRSVIQWISG